MDADSRRLVGELDQRLDADRGSVGDFVRQLDADSKRLVGELVRRLDAHRRRIVGVVLAMWADSRAPTANAADELGRVRALLLEASLVW